MGSNMLAIELGFQTRIACRTRYRTATAWCFEVPCDARVAPSRAVSAWYARAGPGVEWAITSGIRPSRVYQPRSSIGTSATFALRSASFSNSPNLIVGGKLEHVQEHGKQSQKMEWVINLSLCLVHDQLNINPILTPGKSCQLTSTKGPVGICLEHYPQSPRAYLR